MKTKTHRWMRKPSQNNLRYLEVTEAYDEETYLKMLEAEIPTPKGLRDSHDEFPTAYHDHDLVEVFRQIRRRNVA